MKISTKLIVSHVITAGLAVVVTLQLVEQDKPNDAFGSNDSRALEQTKEDSIVPENSMRNGDGGGALAVENKFDLSRMSGVDADAALVHLYENLDPTNLAEGLAYVESIENPANQKLAVRYLVSAWAKFDPLSALEYALQERWGRDAIPIAATALETWSEAESYKAIAWLENSGLDDSRYMLRASIVSGMVKDRPLEAEAYIISQDVPAGIMVAQVAGQYLRESPEVMENWIDSISDDEFRGAAVIAASRMWANMDLDGAVDWATRRADSPYGESALREVSKSLARNDPEAAANWIDGIGKPDLVMDVLPEVLNAWIGQDEEAAMSWIDKHYQGEDRGLVLNRTEEQSEQP